MISLSEEIIDFFQAQGWVLVSTIDAKGFPHNSCKAIIKMDAKGEVLLLDVYHGITYANIERNPQISITAVDEHKFTGYCLKGKAKIMPQNKLNDEIIKAWEDKITSRLTQRLLRNIKEEKGHSSHPEASLPLPKHLIGVEIEEIVDLTPHNLKRRA